MESDKEACYIFIIAHKAHHPVERNPIIRHNILMHTNSLLYIRNIEV